MNLWGADMMRLLFLRYYDLFVARKERKCTNGNNILKYNSYINNNYVYTK